MKRHKAIAYFIIIGCCLLQAGLQVVLGQSVYYSGVLIDADSKEPLPYAHVVLSASPGEGTITNARGRFYLRQKPGMEGPLEVRVSSLGHASSLFTLRPGRTDTLRLQAVAHGLAEVVISPVDFERDLMRRLIARIPINHPTANERLIGEVSEKGFGDTLQARPLYSSRAITAADKQGYQKRRGYGNVAVLQGRVDTFPDFEKSNMRIIAGVFNVHRFDVLQLRLGPFEERRLMNYNFESLEPITFDGVPIQPIRFSGKDAKGTIYINMNDTALHEVDVQVMRGSFESFASGLGFMIGPGRRYLHFKTGYARHDGLYRLKYIHYSTAFGSDGTHEERFFLENTYAINSVEPADGPIPQMERAAFRDKLIDLVEVNPSLAAIDGESTSTPLKLSSGFDRLFTRITFEFGYMFMPYSRNAIAYGSMDAAWPEELSGSLAAKSAVVHAGTYQLNYRINGRFSLIINSAGRFNRMYDLGLIGIEFNQSFGYTARWSLKLAAAGGTESFAWHIADIGNASEYPLLNQEIGFKDTEMSYISQRFVLSPMLSLSYATTRSLRFTLAAVYINPLSGDDYLQFRKKGWSWPWQRSLYLMDQQGDANLGNRFQLQLRVAFGGI